MRQLRILYDLAAIAASAALILVFAFYAAVTLAAIGSF